jgi:CheY-like chemotaxis protein
MPGALIIEDQESNARVLGMLLEQQGMAYSWLDRVDQIDATLDQGPLFDVIFLDLELPTTDGLRLLPLLKLKSRLAGVPIIAYTAHTNQMHTARKLGFDGFLGKPLDAARFPEQLRRILGGEQVWAAS